MNFITSLLGNLNYGTILFLMLLESTVVPVPSEFVVTPAAYHAASGQLDVWLVILFATIGADLGASITKRRWRSRNATSTITASWPR